MFLSCRVSSCMSAASARSNVSGCTGASGSHLDASGLEATRCGRALAANSCPDAGRGWHGRGGRRGCPGCRGRLSVHAAVGAGSGSLAVREAQSHDSLRPRQARGSTRPCHAGDLLAFLAVASQRDPPTFGSLHRCRSPAGFWYHDGSRPPIAAGPPAAPAAPAARPQKPRACKRASLPLVCELADRPSLPGAQAKVSCLHAWTLRGRSVLLLVPCQAPLQRQGAAAQGQTGGCLPYAPGVGSESSFFFAFAHQSAGGLCACHRILTVRFAPVAGLRSYPTCAVLEKCHATA